MTHKIPWRGWKRRRNPQLIKYISSSLIDFSQIYPLRCFKSILFSFQFPDRITFLNKILTPIQRRQTLTWLGKVSFEERKNWDIGGFRFYHLHFMFVWFYTSTPCALYKLPIWSQNRTILKRTLLYGKKFSFMFHIFQLEIFDFKRNLFLLYLYSSILFQT